MALVLIWMSQLGGGERSVRLAAILGATPGAVWNRAARTGEPVRPSSTSICRRAPAGV